MSNPNTSTRKWSVPRYMKNKADSSSFLKKFGFNIIPKKNDRQEVIDWDENDFFYEVNPPSDTWEMISPNTEGTDFGVSDGIERKFNFSKGREATITSLISELTPSA